MHTVWENMSRASDKQTLTWSNAIENEKRTEYDWNSRFLLGLVTSC